MTTETQFLAPGDLGEDAQVTAEAAALLVGQPRSSAHGTAVTPLRVVWFGL
jgi:hypothetical protein